MWDLEICCLRHGAKTSSTELSCHRNAAAGSLQQGSGPSSDHCGLAGLQGWLEPLPGSPALQGQHRETENHSRSHQWTIWSSQFTSPQNACDWTAGQSQCPERIRGGDSNSAQPPGDSNREPSYSANHCTTVPRNIREPSSGIFITNRKSVDSDIWYSLYAWLLSKEPLQGDDNSRFPWHAVLSFSQDFETPLHISTKKWRIKKKTLPQTFPMKSI